MAEFANNPYTNSFFKGQSDPYSWAGKVGVEEGKIAIPNWRPSIVRTKAGDSNDLVAESNKKMRPETKKGAKS